jgi:hypothetical protein
MPSRRDTMKRSKVPVRPRAVRPTSRPPAVGRRDVRAAYVAVVRSYLSADVPPPPVALGHWLADVGVSAAEFATLGCDACTGLGPADRPSWRAQTLDALLREYHAVHRARARRQEIRRLLRVR